jgi:hypothetical protein
MKIYTVTIEVAFADTDTKGLADLHLALVEAANSNGLVALSYEDDKREATDDEVAMVRYEVGQIADEDVNPEACPGCGCLPGDGRTVGCQHPDGCGSTPDSGATDANPVAEDYPGQRITGPADNTPDGREFDWPSDDVETPCDCAACVDRREGN